MLHQLIKQPSEILAVNLCWLFFRLPYLVHCSDTDLALWVLSAFHEDVCKDPLTHRHFLCKKLSRLLKESRKTSLCNACLCQQHTLSEQRTWAAFMGVAQKTVSLGLSEDFDLVPARPWLYQTLEIWISFIPWILQSHCAFYSKDKKLLIKIHFARLYEMCCSHPRWMM